MSSWLLNIVGIVFVGVILEMVMPEGKTTVFIKHIFSVFTMFVIINPIVTFVNEKLDFNANSVVIDSNFIYTNNLNKVSAIETTIKTNVENLGYGKVSVIVNANIFDEVLTYNSVYLDISNLNLNDNEKVDAKEKIKSIVLDVVTINSEDIVFYG